MRAEWWSDGKGRVHVSCLISEKEGWQVTEFFGEHKVDFWNINAWSWNLDLHQYAGQRVSTL